MPAEDDDVRGRRRRAAARWKLGALDDALADAEEMVCQCHEGHVMAGKALYRKGNVLAAMGRTKEARRVYQNSLNLTPDEKAQRPILAKLVEVTNAAVEEKQTEEVRAELHKQREMIRESRELKDLMGLDPKTADKPPKERYHMSTKALKDGDVVTLPFHLEYRFELNPEGTPPRSTRAPLNGAPTPLQLKKRSPGASVGDGREDGSNSKRARGVDGRGTISTSRAFPTRRSLGEGNEILRGIVGRGVV